MHVTTCNLFRRLNSFPSLWLIILFVCLFLLTVCLPIAGDAQQLQEARISLVLNHASLKETIRQIESLTPFKFLANARDIEGEQDITIDVKNQPLDKVLELLFKGRNLQYSQVRSNIILKRMGDPAVQNPAPPSASKAREKYTISGTVRSRRTGESLISATLIIRSDGSPFSAGTTSNEYGFYSMTLRPGHYVMEVSMAGMKSQAVDILLERNTVLNIPMEEGAEDLQAFTIHSSSARRNIDNPQMGKEHLSMGEIRDIPVLLGERDVLKTIQLLPGIKPAGDGNSGFYVRGGTADQNLILLDEATVYNPSHLFGFFSTFNSDAIKNIDVYKAGMPAQYGGRLSSVVDVKMNDGNDKDYSANGGIGLISSRLTVEGPLEKDKSSFIVSGRRTYADLFLKLSGDSTVNKSLLYFYDLNAKVNYRLGGRDHLYLSGYFGRDVLSQDNLVGINWGNTTATARWNHLFNNKLFSNTSLIYSNYDFQINNKAAGNEFNILSQIKDWNLKQELQLYVRTDHSVNLGFDVIHHTIRPGEISASKNAGVNSTILPHRYSLENAVYATDTWKTSGQLSITYGIRLSAFSLFGKGDYYDIDPEGKILDTLHYGPGQVVKTYLNAEPRIAAGYQLDDRTALKASYVRNTQNLHLISNSVASSPTDRWVANTNIIKPELSDQVSLGYYRNLDQDRYELTVEGYYKSMQNQIDYRDGANVYTNQPIETQLLFGKGRAYGIEWQLKKNEGRLRGWISYTLSKTERKIAGINNNQWYNARQDRTHDIAVVGTYRFNKKWTFSADWVFYTGDAITFPSGKYTVEGAVYFYYTKRNGYRMPNYHRLDLGATCQLRQKKKFSSELDFSLYNAYGRENAYQISFRQSKTDPNRTEAVQTSLFRFVPSISYNFKF